MYIPPLGSSVVISGKFGSGKSTLLANLLLDGRFYGPGTLKPKGWFEKIFLFSFTEGLGVTWNSLRFVAVGQGTNSIAYSTNGITWFGLGTSIFTVIVGIGVNSNVGATIVDSAIVLRNNNINKIDIVADEYYNTGWSNMTIVIKSLIL